MVHSDQFSQPYILYLERARASGGAVYLLLVYKWLKIVCCVGNYIQEILHMGQFASLE